MSAPLSSEDEDFLDKNSGMTREQVTATAREAAAHNAARVAAQMQELSEHPLDLAGVPHAEAVLALLPNELHPLVLNSFFTRVREYLVMDGEPVSVREWLIRDGDLETALWCAESEFIS